MLIEILTAYATFIALVFALSVALSVLHFLVAVIRNKQVKILGQ